ncbi:MFS transporter [Agromyces flavus]|uniref:Predicted arabinose efflux permease, MFS family n=2 Tax=Agromyces flavus TaxID=589382 RepID=A0A1H1VZI8_9MICO|nr:MFS transporter [Agromyces flavus]GGI43869.1 MFS transporter [Agromyces flavus]SDS89499.1 Predicted arabinose efflux permease, MFS family [Agromyces flavus]
MTTMTATEPREVRAEHGSPDKLRTAIGSAVGTTIENYDFLAYGTAAALYFSDAFFHAEDPVVGVLLGFATFGIGFAMRPLGGLLGGYLGDKIGRKPVLVGALLLMGISTVLIGVLPTYAQVGLLAPILLTLIRVIQGIAFGAEWGGAILMTFEHAPWRQRGRYTAIPQAGVPLGLLLANLVFLWSSTLDNELAWRLPFLLSAVLIIAGLIIRAKVSESPEFIDTKTQGLVVKNPLKEVFKNDWRNILRVIALRLAESGGFYVIVTYMLSYLTSGDEPITDRATALTGLIIAAALGLFTTILFGSLTDRIGRKPVYFFGTIALIAFAFPMFLLVNTGLPYLIVFVYVVAMAIIHDSLAGTQGAWFSELFNTNTRSSGASVGYQFSAAISGFIPLIATAVAVPLGWGGVALVYMACGVLGLIGTVLTRETWGKRERAEVDAIIERS